MRFLRCCSGCLLGGSSRLRHLYYRRRAGQHPSVGRADRRFQPAAAADAHVPRGLLPALLIHTLRWRMRSGSRRRARALPIWRAVRERGPGTGPRSTTNPRRRAAAADASHEQPDLRRDRHARSRACQGHRQPGPPPCRRDQARPGILHGQRPAGVHEMAEIGLPIFLDLKFHDIPNTVGKAIQALRPLEPAILTVHAAGGRAMMEDAKAAAPTGTKVVAVTMLTSLDADDLARSACADPHEQVVRLTELAMDAGLDGIVCSGDEVAAAQSSGRTASSSFPASALPMARRRPEARRHAARRARCGRIDPRRRATDHRRRRPRLGRARNRATL